MVLPDMFKYSRVLKILEAKIKVSFSCSGLFSLLLLTVCNILSFVYNRVRDHPLELVVAALCRVRQPGVELVQDGAAHPDCGDNNYMTLTEGLYTYSLERSFTAVI